MSVHPTISTITQRITCSNKHSHPWVRRRTPTSTRMVPSGSIVMAMAPFSRHPTIRNRTRWEPTVSPYVPTLTTARQQVQRLTTAMHLSTHRHRIPLRHRHVATMTFLALTHRLTHPRTTPVQPHLHSATTPHATANSGSKRPRVHREVEVAHAAVVVSFHRRASRLARRSRSVVRLIRVTISRPCEAEVLPIATRTVARETCRFFLWIISNSIIIVIDVRLQPIIVKCCLCVCVSLSNFLHV